MVDRKTDKVVAIWLLIVLTIGLGQATKELPPLQNYIEGEMRLNGVHPKVGETFDIVYRIKIKKDADWTLRRDNLEKDYVAIIRCYPSDGIKIVGQDQFFFSGLIPGEIKEFHTRCQILKSVEWIGMDGDIDLAVNGKSYGPVATSGDATLWLIDRGTGQYGTRKEYEGKLSVEYRYDPVDGSFTCSPSQNPAPVEENRRLIKMIKQLETALSDSEALLLHSDQYRIGVPEGLPRWDENNNRWLEEEIFEYYLKDGWYRALREGRREEWIQNEKNKVGQALGSDLETRN